MSTHRILSYRSLSVSTLGAAWLWGAVEVFALWRSRHLPRRRA